MQGTEAESTAPPRTEHAGEPARASERAWRRPESPAERDRQFEAIYSTWYGEVARWVRSLGARPAEQEDLTQEVFIIAYQRLHEFDGRNVRAWLYQIARHRVRDFRRLRWSRLLLDSESPSENLASPIPNPETQRHLEERKQMLRRLLSKLPASGRATLVMFEIEGYSGEEIAQIQRIPINTVWGRLHKARKELHVRADRLNKSLRESIL